MSDFDNQHIWHPYAKIPPEVPSHKVKSASGVYLTLANGNKIIDGMSSWWSAIHGYNHPVLNRAIATQLDKMAHIMFGGLTHDTAIELAQILLEITPKSLAKVFFVDSGSVAVEVALKMALQYQQGQNQATKQRFITIKGGYHGDTFATMSVSDPENSQHKMWHKMSGSNFFAQQPNLENTEAALADLHAIFAKNHQKIAALILEPIVQGAGGMNIYSPKYLQGARAICDEFGALLILDEVATGFGRTGKMLALEHAKISPDILCLGKSLSGGYLSIAATMTSDLVAKKVGKLLHGPTFMANPLACAVSIASIKLLQKSNWQARIKRIETILKTELSPLKNHKKVQDVRIIGAIGIVEMMDNINIQKTQNFLIKQGVWLRPFGKLLYTMPPFSISDAELLTITTSIKSLLKRIDV